MKQYLVIALILLTLVLIGAGYYWKTGKTQKPSSSAASPATTTNSTNSTENVQSANPYEKTNPFSNIKVNPFE